MPSKPLHRAGNVEVTPRVHSGGLDINTSQIEQAPLAGFVNRCSIVPHETVVEFVFWEETHQGEIVAGARVYVPDVDLAGSVWSLWGPMLAELRTGGQIGPTVGRIEDVPAIRPDGLAAVANILPIARSASSAMLDMHYVSPLAVVGHTRGQSTKMTISPMFSIFMPTTLLLAMLEHVERLVPVLRAGIVGYSPKAP